MTRLRATRLRSKMAIPECIAPGDRERGASFLSGVYSWLVKVLGQFSIIYFRGLGLRIGVWVRVGVRGWVRVSVVLWSG